MEGNPAAAAGGGGLTASQVNSFRINSVADRLNLHVGTHPKEEPFEFFNLCLSLARGIDYAVANDEVPEKSQDLPKLLKKVCGRKTLLLQAAIMVLMVSVKSACKAGWFSNEDSRELLTLADEVSSSFSSVRDMNTEENGSLQNISTIMGRFYPHLKMGLTLSSLEVKPGYGTYLTDFHIPKSVKTSAEEKVRLFVAQIDNAETSSCLISPPQANFLINGKGVEKRTNVTWEGGPLLPTTIMPMLKYGTNILQVVGQFSGNYVIVVAFMSVISDLDKSVLLDYVQPEVTVHDQDSELVEGPSRISLNCPISFQRIKTPVKGLLCKHKQCFDFDNFVDMNSRRPSWRCPHCNQCVSYVDIRVDQYMAKVLKEVEVGVAEVIISADGSYNPVTQSHENSNPPHDSAPSCPQDVPAQQNGDNSNIPVALLDLTEGDDLMEESGPIEIEDVKPILADIPNHLEVENTTLSPITTNPNVLNQNSDDFWSRMFMSTYSPEGSAFRSQSQMFASVANAASSQLHLPQSQFGNSSNEYGTDLQRTRPRVQVAVQALPAQSPTLVPQHTLLRHNSSNVTVSMGDGLDTTIERQIPMSRSHLNSLQASQTNVSHFNPLYASSLNASQYQAQLLQNWHHQSQIPQPTIPQISRQYSIPPPNLRVPQGMVQSPNLTRSSSQSPRIQFPTVHSQTPLSQRPSNGVFSKRPNSPAFNQSNRATSPVPSAREGIRTLMGERGGNIVDSSAPSVGPTNGILGRRPNTTPVFNQSNRATSSVPSAGDGVMNIVDSSTPTAGPTNDEWRPSGRMRGALQGEAYSAAQQRYIFQPVQPVQATRPPTLPVLPLLVANNRNAHEVPSSTTMAAHVPDPTSAQ